MYERLTHIDLFSGIGGFALAADRVFGNVEHIFCDNEPFAQEVLKKHWPEAQIYGDIRTLTADTEGERVLGSGNVKTKGGNRRQDARASGVFILTGGFPCQPFSQAGRRRGEADDRFLWPEMLRVIREFSPLWVIAENVRGLLTQGGGVVFERVCTDLEAAGYEVQPLIIPAVAVGAPHRRDRVWFVAHRTSERPDNGEHNREGRYVQNDERTYAKSEPQRNGRRRGTGTDNTVTQDSIGKRGGRWMEGSRQVLGRESTEVQDERPDWSRNWLEVATRLCRVDDGIRNWVDGRGKKRNSRNARLKALGNAIVPAVAEQIMRAIPPPPQPV